MWCRISSLRKKKANFIRSQPSNDHDTAIDNFCATSLLHIEGFEKDSPPHVTVSAVLEGRKRADHKTMLSILAGLNFDDAKCGIRDQVSAGREMLLYPVACRNYSSLFHRRPGSGFGEAKAGRETMVVQSGDFGEKEAAITAHDSSFDV